MLKKDYDKLKKELRQKNQFLPDIAKYQDNPIALEPFEKNVNTFNLTFEEHHSNDNLITILGIIFFIGILIII